MKSVSVLAAAAAIVPGFASAAFWAPSGRKFLSNSKTSIQAADDVPDIVKAYQKAKSPPSFLDPSMPSSATSPPAVPDVVTPDVVAAATPDVSADMDVSQAAPSLSAAADAVASTVQAAADSAAAAGSSAVDDFIQSARSTYESTAMSIVDSPRSPDEAVNLGAYVQNGIDAVRDATDAVTAATSTAPPEKVPTLAGYITGAEFLKRSPPTPGQVGGFANFKAKIGLLFQNTAKMFGLNIGGNAAGDVAAPKLDVPDMHLQHMDSNLRNMQAPDLVTTLATIPDGSVGWAAAGVAILVAAGQRRAGIADAKYEMKSLIEKEASAVAQLAGEVNSLGGEIKQLKGETTTLRTKLREATEKLNKKELEISKEKLKLVDKEMKLNREMDQLKAKVDQGDSQIKQLQNELKETQKIRTQLVKATEKLKEMEQQLVDARNSDTDVDVEEISRMEEEFNFFMNEVIPSTPKEPEPELEITSDDNPPVRVNGYTADSTAAAAVMEAPAKTVKSAKAKKSPAKRTIKVKKKSAKTVVAEAVTAPAPPKAKAAAVTKAAPKAKAVKKTTPKGSTKAAVQTAPETIKAATEDWTGLSDSTLLRKTVKELTAYLEAKNVGTIDENGKTKKKVQLIEAIRDV